MKCVHCGAEIEEGDVICSKCGEYVESEQVKPATSYYNPYDSVKDREYKRVTADSESTVDPYSKYRNVDQNTFKAIKKKSKYNPIIAYSAYFLSVIAALLMIASTYQVLGVESCGLLPAGEKNIKLYNNWNGYILIAIGVFTILMCLIKSRAGMVIFDILGCAAVAIELKYLDKINPDIKKYISKVKEDYPELKYKFSFDKEIGYDNLMAAAAIMVIAILVYLLLGRRQHVS